MNYYNQWDHYGNRIKKGNPVTLWKKVVAQVDTESPDSIQSRMTAIERLGTKNTLGTFSEGAYPIMFTIPMIFDEEDPPFDLFMGGVRK
ncbi:hypothetical protein KC901_01555 [Patescibacteria group bacterium]|nr:hypothetical protein [Patescibacteria group bacterium]MCA9352848.1 hypothetical protein [Patescibacteria group bacterium]